MTLPSGRALSWTYDAANRITGVTGTPPGGGSAKTYASSVAYASHGDISQMTLGNNLVETRGYDAYRQQPASVKLGTSTTDWSRLALTYSYCPGVQPPAPGGQPTYCTNNNGNVQGQALGLLSVTQTYGYDGLNRLTGAIENPGQGSAIWREAYAYDDFGNRWVDTGNTSGLSLSPLTPTARADYYDTTGTITANRYTWPANYGYDNGNSNGNGNLTFVSPYTIGYDVENRQIGITSQMNGSASYVYDGDGRRVGKTAGSATTVYVYDATGQLAAEYAAAPPALTGTLYLTTDPLGSTRAVTDGTGAAVAYHDYLPFGEEIPTGTGPRGSLYGASDGVTQRYTGKERDAETGLDYFGARYFSSAQGRFTTPDPVFMTRERMRIRNAGIFTPTRGTARSSSWIRTGVICTSSSLAKSLERVMLTDTHLPRCGMIRR